MLTKRTRYYSRFEKKLSRMSASCCGKLCRHSNDIYKFKDMRESPITKNPLQRNVEGVFVIVYWLLVWEALGVLIQPFSSRRSSLPEVVLGKLSTNRINLGIL